MKKIVLTLSLFILCFNFTIFCFDESLGWSGKKLASGELFDDAKKAYLKQFASNTVLHQLFKQDTRINSNVRTYWEIVLLLHYPEHNFVFDKQSQNFKNAISEYIRRECNIIASKLTIYAQKSISEADLTTLKLKYELEHIDEIRENGSFLSKEEIDFVYEPLINAATKISPNSNSLISSKL